MGAHFKAFGHFIPLTAVTNTELADRFAITSEWIEHRTGIIERRYFEDGATSDMIVAAVHASGVDLHGVDCIIVATMTPDYHCPSTAAIVQQKLGLNHTFAFDLMAACSGFLYALQLADALITAKKYRNILVCGADKMSSVIDPGDRKTTLILGDGAGYCLLSDSAEHNDMLATVCQLDSSSTGSVVIPNGGSARPINENVLGEQDHFLRFTDKKIFEGGLQLFLKAIKTVLTNGGISIHEVDLIVPHQANKRMIEELARRLDVPLDKFFINIEYIGNTSAATIPIGLSQAHAAGKLQGIVLLASVGAGFTYGASLLNFNVHD